MKYKYYKKTIALILSVVFLLVSCSNDDTVTPENIEKDAMLNFSIRTTLATDPLTKGGDGSFSSLALYVFNKATGYCEYSQLIPNFTPQAVQEFSKSISVSMQTKMIYAVANYNDVNKNFSTPVTPSLTMAQLEALTVSNLSFTDTNILMVGRKEVNINSAYVTAEIPMERLVSRMDIYFFKSIEAQNDPTEIISVEFINQVLNTRCRYQNNVMISPVTKTNRTGVITANPILTTMPSDLSGLIPANAHTSFYSYQNIAASATTPNDNISPYLKVKLKIEGSVHTYKGYITDNAQGANQYSLMRNTVYRVIAMVDKLNNDLILKTSVLPWNVAGSEIGHGVKDTNYALTPFNGNNVGATTGIVQYPYMENGVGRDQTSYASYNFKLTAPKGAVWTATLTNGLDFTFNTIGTTAGKVAVSTGIARTDAYEIKVGATKSWGGTTRSTYMYITVDGIKLKINPVISGTTRKFPGTNDTDILITQTKYQ